MRATNIQRPWSILWALPLAAFVVLTMDTSLYAESPSSLKGKRIGVAVLSSTHFWTQEVLRGTSEAIEELGGEEIAVDGQWDNQLHADNHDELLAGRVDVVISILGDNKVEPKFKVLNEAGIPVFTVDHPSPHSINNTTSDNYYMGTTIGRLMAGAIGGKGNVAIFNAFEDTMRFCEIRAKLWKFVMQDYPNINVLQPELKETLANAPENARLTTLELLDDHPTGELDAIHIGCWDQPAIGVFQALHETGRTEIKVTGLDAGPKTLKLMMKEGSTFVANVAQQPYLIGRTAVMNVSRYFVGERLLPETYVDVIPVNGPIEAEAVYETLGYGSIY